MKPIRTERSNQIFNPPPGGSSWCDAVWAERTYVDSPGGRLPAIKLTFELDPNELVHLNHHANVELTIIGQSMPPVSLGIAPRIIAEPLPLAMMRVPGPPTPPDVPGPKPVG